MNAIFTLLDCSHFALVFQVLSWKNRLNLCNKCGATQNGDVAKVFPLHPITNNRCAGHASSLSKPRLANRKAPALITKAIRTEKLSV